MTLRQKQEYMKNSIIDRKEEIALLEKYMTSNHSDFIAIYGRRRVGKTFLIRHYFQNRFAFDMTGIIEGKKAEQLTAFNHAMKQYGYKGRKPSTWLDAFLALRDLLEQKLEQWNIHRQYYYSDNQIFLLPKHFHLCRTFLSVPLF